jgi:catechol 2,3-dioxygenase-like lactoylglutathione lyase family enzyme
MAIGHEPRRYTRAERIAKLARVTMNLRPVEIKAFVPTKDYAQSRKFYEAIGFTCAFADDEIAYFHLGECSFLLQNFHAVALAENFMMHLLVENVDDWHAHLTSERIAERFGVRLDVPVDQPWAMRDFVLFDPSGALWRIAQNISRKDTN